MNGVYTDLPSMAWLVSAAALSAASVERPALLAPAIVAAGLSVGTKTTTLPLAGLALAAGLYVNRSHLRGLVRPLTIATATALAVGGYWYLRNLVDHGSPFWPLLWGETVPFRTQGVDDSFLERFRTAFDAFSREGVDLLAGGMVLILAAMLAPIFARTRETVISAIATSVSLLAWLNAPYTGTLTIATLRYLLPTLAVATLTVALAGRSRRGRPYALATLAVAAALNAWQTLRLGFPRVPGLDIVAAGAVLGTLAAAACRGFRAAPPSPVAPVVPAGESRRGGSGACGAPLACGIRLRGSEYAHARRGRTSRWGAGTRGGQMDHLSAGVRGKRTLDRVLLLHAGAAHRRPTAAPARAPLSAGGLREGALRTTSGLVCRAAACHEAVDRQTLPGVGGSAVQPPGHPGLQRPSVAKTPPTRRGERQTATTSSASSSPSARSSKSSTVIAARPGVGVPALARQPPVVQALAQRGAESARRSRSGSLAQQQRSSLRRSAATSSR